MPVINIQPLRIRDTQHIPIIPSQIHLSRIITWGFRDRVRQPSGRVPSTIEHVRDGVAGFLASEARPEDRGDVGMLDPWLEDERADAVDDDDRVVVVCGDGLDERVAPMPGGQVLSVDIGVEKKIIVVIIEYTPSSLNSQHNHSPITFIPIYCDIILTTVRRDEHKRGGLLIRRVRSTGEVEIVKEPRDTRAELARLLLDRVKRLF